MKDRRKASRRWHGLPKRPTTDLERRGLRNIVEIMEQDMASRIAAREARHYELGDGETEK